MLRNTDKITIAHNFVSYSLFCVKTQMNGMKYGLFFPLQKIKTELSSPLCLLRAATCGLCLHVWKWSFTLSDVVCRKTLSIAGGKLASSTGGYQIFTK